MLLSRNDQLLAKVKQGIKAEGEKQVSKVMQNLPSPSSLQSQFGPRTVHSQEEFDKIEKQYAKIKSFLKNSKLKLERSKKSLLKIKQKTIKVKDTITKISGIFDKLNPIISALNTSVTVAKTLITAVGFIPPPYTAPSGPLIIANDAAKLAKGKITSFKALISGITKVFPYYIRKVEGNLTILNPALEALDKLIAKIDLLLKLLEQLYLMLLKNMLASTKPKTGEVDPIEAASTPEEIYLQNPDLGQGLIECTLPDGTIKIMTKKECLGAGGLCCGLIACTLPDGSVQPLTPKECLAIGGTFKIDEESLEPFEEELPKVDSEPGVIGDKEYIEYTREEDGEKRGYRRYKK